MTTSSPPLSPFTVIETEPHHLEGHAPPNKLPPDLRDQIAQAVLVDKRKIKEVAEAFGVHRNSITPIVREYFSEMAELNNLTLSSEIGEVTQAMLTRIKENIDNIPLQQLAVAFGILLDKRRDLTGKVAASAGGINLRVAWKDGSGAIELNAGKD